jgi:hypothetical protein
VNEAYVRGEIHRLAKQLGYVPATQTNAARCPQCGAKVLPPLGWPDMQWLAHDSRVVEVKVVPAGRRSFPFADIRPEQREWLDWWVGTGRAGYLAIGTLDRPRRLWLVEWRAWKQIEDLLRPYQDSIPVLAGKGMRQELQRMHLDMDHLLSDWELTRVPNGWAALHHPMEVCVGLSCAGAGDRTAGRPAA